MTKCEHWDAGWCYAPVDVKTNAIGKFGVCKLPEYCPYLKSQNQMNEIDMAKVLIEGDTATIMGVKYKRVEEPKPETLYEALTNIEYIGCCYDDILDAVRCWLPKEQSAKGSQNVYVECTVDGFNDCLDKIKSKLK